MKRKWKIGLLFIVLFGIESIFSNYFPEYLFSVNYIFVPRFLFMLLIMVAIYYDWKKAVYIAALLGAVTDIVFIEVFGIYLFWYPVIIYGISKLMKIIHSHLFIVAVVTALAITVLEFGIYGIFFVLGIHDFSVNYFAENRLVPTLILNEVMFVLFSYPLKKRLTLWNMEKEEEEGMFQS